MGKFRSKKQWKWAFATGQPFARRWAHSTPGGKGKRYKKLPNKVKGKAAKGRTVKKGKKK